MQMQVKLCFERNGQNVMWSMVMFQEGEQKALGFAVLGVASVEIAFEVETMTRTSSSWMF